MKKLILVSTPDPGALQRVLDQVEGRPFHWTYLGQTILQYRRAQELFSGRGAYLDTSDRFHQATRELREPYLEYLFNISHALDSLHWWLTSLSWRDYLASNAFRRTCHLKTALEVASAWELPEPLVLVADEPVCRAIQSNLGRETGAAPAVYGISKNPPLRPVIDTLNMLGHRTVFVMREAYKIFYSRRLLPKPAEPAGMETLLISWGTATSLRQGGEFHRSFFGDLADRMTALKGRVAVVPMIAKEVRYKEALRQLENCRLPLCVPHSFFGAFDPIKAGIMSIRKPARPKEFSELSGMCVAPLLEPELREHWISNQPAALMMTTLLVRRWAKWSPSIARIIYMYENKTWERALCWQARKSLPQTKLVGYSPTPVSKLQLNFFLAPGEAGTAPLPDRVVTVGEQPGRLLSSDGYEPDSIKVGGALRMQDLDALGTRSKTLPVNHEPVVLVAPTSGPEETAELAYIAAHLFEADDGVRVVLKCHPMMGFDQVSGSIGGPLPSHVEVSDEPIDDLILKSSLMVYSTSSVCIDALALGVPVVNLRPQFNIDADPLDEFPEARPEATGLGDLREKVRWLLDHREEYVNQHRDAWSSIAKDMYAPVTPESIQAFTA
jgi:hypothetical protein